ncbi:hypothetical protein ACJX0J_005941, partial [Zea mays]
PFLYGADQLKFDVLFDVLFDITTKLEATKGRSLHTSRGHNMSGQIHFGSKLHFIGAHVWWQAKFNCLHLYNNLNSEVKVVITCATDIHESYSDEMKIKLFEEFFEPHYGISILHVVFLYLGDTFKEIQANHMFTILLTCLFFFWILFIAGVA